MFSYRMRDFCKGCGGEVMADIFHRKRCPVCEGKSLEPCEFYEREEYTCPTCGETWEWERETGWKGSMGTIPRF